METDKDRAARHEKWKNDTYAEYLGNNMKKLRRLALSKCGKMLQNGNLHEDDFLSEANEVLYKAVDTYDERLNDNFQAFLMVCLQKRFCTIYKSINSHAPTSSNAIPIEESTRDDIGLAEIISCGKNVEDCINPYDLSDEAFDYVSSFYGIYSDVIELIMDGYPEDDIREMLHLSRREYADCMCKLRSRKHLALLKR